MHSLDVNRPPDSAPPSDTSAEIAPDLAMDTSSDASPDMIAVVDTAPDKTMDKGADVAVLGDTICDELGPGVVFCDGFEDASLAPWEVLGSAPWVTVSQTDAYRGQGALQVSSHGDWSGVGKNLKQSYSSKNLHLRAYLRVDQVDMTGISVFFLTNSMLSEILTVGVGENGAPFVRVDGYEAQSTFGLAPGVWACLQLEVKIAQPGGSAKLSIDGQQVAAITNADTLPNTGISRLGAGLLAVREDNPPVGVLIDEVVVSTQPVPCD